MKRSISFLIVAILTLSFISAANAVLITIKYEGEVTSVRGDISTIVPGDTWSATAMVDSDTLVDISDPWLSGNQYDILSFTYEISNHKETSTSGWVYLWDWTTMPNPEPNNRDSIEIIARHFSNSTYPAEFGEHSMIQVAFGAKEETWDDNQLPLSYYNDDLMYNSIFHWGFPKSGIWIRGVFTSVTIEAEGVTIDISLDIKPDSCPNPLNVKSRGVLPVTIVGSEDLDVSEINVASIRFENVAPLRSSIENVGSPEDSIDCNYFGPDGFNDLSLKFDTQDIVNAIGDVNDGDIVTLKMTGQLNDGTEIEGEDDVVIKKKGKK